MNDATCTVLSVRSKPFAVPRGLLNSAPSVSCQVADSSGGGGSGASRGSDTVAILLTRTHPVENAAAADQWQQQRNSNTLPISESSGNVVIDNNPQQQEEDALQQSQQQQQQQQVMVQEDAMVIQRIPLVKAAAVDPAAGGAAGGSSAAKFSNDAITAWRLARYLKLANVMSPRLLPNVLPLIAAYRHQKSATTASSTDARKQLELSSSSAAVYICQPHMGDTLAAATRAAPRTVISLAQIRTITRELLDALSLMHRNGVVVLDMAPSTIRVNLALRARSDVAIAVSRPVLSHTPMPGTLFVKLLQLPEYGHRYLAPEVVAQVIEAGSGSCVWGASPADAAARASLPETSQVTVGTAADVWSLACILVEMVTGKPLFPSESILEHGAVVNRILSVRTFPESAQRAVAAVGGNSPPQSPRYGMFSGLHISSALQTALAGTDACFRQLVAAMLQIEPALRPTADDIIRSPFISGNAVGGGGGRGGGIMDASSHARQFGSSAHASSGQHHHPGRRNSGGGGSSNSRQQAGAGKGGAALAATMSGLHGTMMGMTMTRSGSGSALDACYEFGRDWAVPDPTMALEVISEVAPLMP